MELSLGVCDLEWSDVVGMRKDGWTDGQHDMINHSYREKNSLNLQASNEILRLVLHFLRCTRNRYLLLLTIVLFRKMSPCC